MSVDPREYLSTDSEGEDDEDEPQAVTKAGTVADGEESSGLDTKEELDA
jgi:hypothetical protein